MSDPNTTTACYLCGCVTHSRRNGTVRDNPELAVLECSQCKLVFLSSFDHIEKDFYEQSGMHSKPIDIKSWLSQTAVDDERRFTQFRRTAENKSVLDFGCGAGGFLARLKGVASSVCGVEVESRLASHFSEVGLDVRRSIEEFDQTFDLITLFHVLEHFPDPASLLVQLSAKLKPGGRIIVEVPNSEDVLLTLYHCDSFANFTYWGCHLFLFNAATLSALVDKAGLTLDYVRHYQRYSVANHLHWLAKGKPGGHAAWHFLDSDELCGAYEKSLASIGRTDTLLASVSTRAMA